MKQINMLPEIIEFYLCTIEEVLRVEFKYIAYKHMIYCTIDDTKEIYDILNEEISGYIENVTYEMRALLFMIRNEKRLIANDINIMLDKFDENFKERYEYLEELEEVLADAILNSKETGFVLPAKRIPFLDENDYNTMLSQIKGYNEDELECFLVDEQIIEPNEFDDIRKKCKILKGNIKKELSLFGTYENVIVVPEIKDELSMCINIHEMVNYVLLRMNNIDKEIVESEDLSKFYELLFQKFNSFSKENIKPSRRALMLLEDYHDEPFKVQIRKISKIK